MNWHQMHEESRNYGQRLADKVATNMGSWKFIIIQTIIVIIWMTLNVVSWFYHWDIYPFILLNLVFSTQAAYAAPIIMMAQNRQSDRDREQALADFKINVEAKNEIESLAIQLKDIEIEKLDKMLEIIRTINEHNHSHLEQISSDVLSIKEKLNGR